MRGEIIMTNPVKMPILFIGHGSPMNAIENNEFTKGWTQIADKIPRPDAILSISAHWYTPGSRIMDSSEPEMIYDMYGFPNELYRLEYRAKGAPGLAHLTKNLISRKVSTDNSWGYDHGTWSVLCRMYPDADIPVYQLSVDSSAPGDIHYQIGKEISSLREKGVLILGSGNVVHNLSKISWNTEGGFPWAVEFDAYIKEKIINGQYTDVVNYHQAGKSSELAFYSPDHFHPLLYILGAARDDDQLTIFNDACIMGSLSMTSYLFA
jgi:4,5-DOPA dioxygenase extradiol